MGRPDGKNLQILDLHRLASLDICVFFFQFFFVSIFVVILL